MKKKIKVIKLLIAIKRITELTVIIMILLILISKREIYKKMIITVILKIKIRTIYRILKSTKLSGFLHLNPLLVVVKKEEH